jgi:hypothetical protein
MAVGPAAVFGTTQVLGSDGQYHLLPTPVAAAIDCTAVQGCIPYATPAQTVAGTATALVVNPADLTAKLANQPAAGTCTDREDVVWNGTILQGAAKHYSFSGSFPSIYFPATAGTSVPSGTIAAQSVAITNPSPCRTLRVDFYSSAGGSGPSVSTAVGTNVFSKVSVAGTDYLTNLGQEISTANEPLTAFGSGILSKAYLDIAPGATVNVDYSVLLSGTPLLFNQNGQLRAFVTYSAQTI